MNVFAAYEVNVVNSELSSVVVIVVVLTDRTLWVLVVYTVEVFVTGIVVGCGVMLEIM